MKLTKSKLKQIIKEELAEVFRIRSPQLEDRMRAVRNQLGDDVFFNELINSMSDEALAGSLRKIAANQQLTVGGVRHFEESNGAADVINDTAWDAHKVAIKNIQAMSRGLSDEDSYAFLTLLKKWFNKNILEGQ